MRLEIGPGQDPLPGDWRHWNGGWGTQRYDCPDGTFTEVYASHVVEHVSWYYVRRAIREVRRILAPGGLLELWTMNFDAIVRAYLDGRCGDSWRRHNKEGDFMQWVNGRVFSYGPPDGQEDNWHKSLFTPASLALILGGEGFQDVRTLGPDERTRGISHGPAEFGIMARRP